MTLRISPVSSGSSAEVGSSKKRISLQGTATPAQKNVILANAACGISIIDRNLSVEESVAKARESLDSGAALFAFKRFVALNS